MANVRKILKTKMQHNEAENCRLPNDRLRAKKETLHFSMKVCRGNKKKRGAIMIKCTGNVLFFVGCQTGNSRARYARKLSILTSIAILSANSIITLTFLHNLMWKMDRVFFPSCAKQSNMFPFCVQPIKYFKLTSVAGECVCVCSHHFNWNWNC